MRIVIEGMVAIQRLKGSIDLREAQNALRGSRYQPEIFKGLLLDHEDPPCKVFLLEDGTIRLHGIKSRDSAARAIGTIVGSLNKAGIDIKAEGTLEVREVIASHDMGQKLDPSKVLEVFKGERIIYDPRVLPGFILRIPSTYIETLIFPEGKIVSRGGRSVEDCASALQIVANKLEPARKV